MRNYTYLREGNLYKNFIIEESTSSINTSGRTINSYDTSSTKILKGILTDADPQEKYRWEQLSHPISHVIVQDGTPKAKAKDRLLYENRVFYIQGVDNISNLGIKTLYYVEERFDLK